MHIYIYTYIYIYCAIHCIIDTFDNTDKLCQKYHGELTNFKIDVRSDSIQNGSFDTTPSLNLLGKWSRISKDILLRPCRVSVSVLAFELDDQGSKTSKDPFII